MADRDTMALVRRAVEEIWNGGELHVADVLFAADYINHAGLISDLIRGPEAIKISVVFYRTAFPNFHITMDELMAKRDVVLLRWTARRAPLPDSVASVAPGRLSGIIVCRCAGGQIVESWTHWDQAGMLEQLGRFHRQEPPGTVPTSAR